MAERAEEKTSQLSGDAKQFMHRELNITRGRLRRLTGEVRSLTPQGFGARWERIYEKLQRLKGDANDRFVQAAIMVASDVGKAPWQIFITRAITNHRLLSNQWPGEIATLPAIRLSACHGEYESATFSVYAVRDLHNIRVAISDLKSNDHTLPASLIEPYAVKCWYQAGRGLLDITYKQLAPELLLKDDELVRVDYETQRNLVRAAPGSSHYLDVTTLTSGDSLRLDVFTPKDAKELQPVNLPAGNLKQFWLTAHIPQDAEPGVYHGEITLSADDVVSTHLPVVIQVLPFELLEPSLTYSIYYRARLSPDGQPTIGSEYKSEDQFLVELRDMKAHGVLYPTNYAGIGQNIHRILELRQEAGLPTDHFYNLGRGTGSPTSEEELNALKNDIKKWLDLVAEFGYKETFVAGTKGTFEAMGGRLDAMIWMGQPLAQEAAKFHSVGSKIFSYANPQVGREEPETYRRNFGLLLWKMNFDGAMDYAYQHGFGPITHADPAGFGHVWNDFDGRVRSHVFAYPTVDGVIGTVQWEGFREAVDDVRYITTLEQAIAQATDTQAAHEAQEWLDSIDPYDDLYAIRSQAIDWILKLTQ